MPAVSKKQQRFFGIVRSIQKGEQKPTTPETAKAASSMKMKSVKKFAKTKHKGLPEKKKVDENLSFTFGTDKGFDVNVYGTSTKNTINTINKLKNRNKVNNNATIKKQSVSDQITTAINDFQKTEESDMFAKEDVKTELLTKAREKHKKAKSFKQFRRDSQKPLKRGEVRKYDPTSKSYKSNMSEVLEPISVPLKKIKTDLDNRKRVKDFQDRFRSPDRKLADEYEPELQEKSAAWQRKEGKNKSGGLNEKGRKSYERENPGSDLKAPQPQGGPRKRSFCARMGGVKGPMKKPDGSPTRKALALRKWKC